MCLVVSFQKECFVDGLDGVKIWLTTINSGNKYRFVIVDDLTRYTWVLFLSDKSDAFASFKSFSTISIRQVG